MLCHSISRTALVGAAALFLTAVDARPQSHRLQNFSAESVPQKTPRGTKPRTLEQYQAEAKRTPADPAALNNLAVAYARSGRLSEALEAGLRSAAIRSDVVVTQMNVAVIYDRLGQTKLARERAALAVTLAPGQLRNRVYVCELDFALDRLRDAVVCYRSVVRDFPTEYVNRHNLGTLLIRLAQFSEARIELEKVREKDPQNPYVLNTLGMAYHGLKEHRRAAQLFKEAVELDPDRPEFRYNLAVSYVALKNRDGALSQYNLLKQRDSKVAQSLHRILFGKYILDARR